MKDRFVDNMKNWKIKFRVFDQDSSGTIRFHELLLAFSMSMRGSGNIRYDMIKHQLYSYLLAEEKLKWAFKLYDIDRSGRVEQDEFESIFETLCR